MTSLYEMEYEPNPLDDAYQRQENLDKLLAYVQTQRVPSVGHLFI